MLDSPLPDGTQSSIGILDLPGSAALQPEIPADRRPEVGMEAALAHWRGARILVVDDDAEMRAYLEEELQDAGFEAFSAPSALDGLIALLGDKPDVIVLDWKMPLLDGFSLLGSVGRCAPDIPVIFVTAYGRPEVSFKAMYDGAFAFLQKPFPLSRLLAEIEDALSLSKALRKPRLLRASMEA